MDWTKGKEWEVTRKIAGEIEKKGKIEGKRDRFRKDNGKEGGNHVHCAGRERENKVIRK